MNNNLLEKYASLIVKVGINLQKGQTLVIVSPIESAPFTRLIAEIAYQAGARDVVVSWKDELLSKIRFLHAPEEAFLEFPEWEKEFYLSYLHQGAAFLTIYASDPEIMKDVDPERISKVQKIRGIALKEHRESLMSNKNAWCIVAVPARSWAKKVFPDLPEDQAIEKLWDAILKCVRVDTEDPVAAWTQHKANLKRTMDLLNSAKLKTLYFKNSLGTDLQLDLPQNHIWLGGSEYTPDGVEFVANMPTEEVFTVPIRTGVNGKVVSPMPLNYNGSLIEQFSLTFKDGRIVDFSAEKGYEQLKNLIATDEGSSYLGEVALVPYNSPISNLRTLFFNTLFDENASCHLAIGKGYPCVKQGDKKSGQELLELGVNDSVVHEDFMIGTADLEIIGIDAQGKKVTIFNNGNFAF